MNTLISQLFAGFSGHKAINQQPYTNKAIYKIVKSELRKRQDFDNKLAKTCLMDKERTLTLMDIISASTRHGMVGVDLGAGSGILGFAFLNAGGAYLYAVEKEKGLVSFVNELADYFGFSQRMLACNEDVVAFKPAKKIDFVIAEMIETGLSHEPIVPAVLNISDYTNPDAVYVPSVAVSSITILDRMLNPLSRKVVYDYADFAVLDRQGVDAIVEVPIIKDGMADTVRIGTYLKHPNGRLTGAFKSLCMPGDLPLYFCDQYSGNDKSIFFQPRNAMPVEEGQKVLLKIKYEYGTSMLGTIATTV